MAVLASNSNQFSCFRSVKKNIVASSREGMEARGPEARRQPVHKVNAIKGLERAGPGTLETVNPSQNQKRNCVKKKKERVACEKKKVFVCEKNEAREKAKTRQKGGVAGM